MGKFATTWQEFPIWKGTLRIKGEAICVMEKVKNEVH